MNNFSCDYFYSCSAFFTDNVKSLLQDIDINQNVIKLVFFGASKIESYADELLLIKKLVNLHFDNSTPLISYIVQPLNDANKMGVELHYLADNIAAESLVFKTLSDINYLVIEYENEKTLMLEGVLGDTITDSISQQSDCIFKKIEAILLKENMPIQSIVRQWNYIGNITSETNNFQHYQAFNDSRTQFYEKANWDFGYPAATGISMSIDCVIVSLIAFVGTSNSKIYPLNNSLQLAAHKYTASVLIGNAKKTTPKFERAKVLLNNDGGICYISGTAAIRDEHSMSEMDVALQTKQTIENIEYLISSENLKVNNIAQHLEFEIDNLRVYIKNSNDFEAVKLEVKRKWPLLPVIYTQAEICRTELLVEIEGYALSK